VAQELVALRYKDNKMNWEYSWIIVSGTPTNLLSVATAIADVFRNNGISVGRNLAKIFLIF
jgi:hypothetical protein